MSVANGKSIIKENIFENRFGFCKELKKMGAKIYINDEKNCAEVLGVKELKGTTVICNDLRGGASLITAGLVSKGKTIVLNAENVLRGYEKIDKKLQNLGADIELIN